MLPLAPQYWRVTPTLCRPRFGNPVSSIASSPVRAGPTVRNRSQTTDACHGEWGMKCCNAW
jgi:hypothetical protein